MENVTYQGKTIAVALSGGRDSMALLHYMCSIAGAQGFRVAAVNVNHNMREESSLRDTLFVQEYCKNVGVPLVCYSVDVYSRARLRGETPEEAARALRYDCFSDLITKKQADLVATAHHSGDQTETILLRLLRGTSVAGLAGIPARRGNFIRPLLTWSREDVNTYVAYYNIPYVEDETNANTDFARNYLRGVILPPLRERFPALDGSIARLAESSFELDRFLTQLTLDKVFIWDRLSALYKKDGVALKSVPAQLCRAFPQFFSSAPPALRPPDTVYLQRKLLNEDIALIKKTILTAFRTLDVRQDVEERHLTLLLSFFNSPTGYKLNMPFNVSVYKEYDRMVFIRGIQAQKHAIEYPLFPLREHYRIGDYDAFVRPYQRGDTIRFALSQVPEGAVIRTRKNADSYVTFSGKTKSLGDYLTDIKVPLRLRGELPLLAVGNRVLAICDLGITQSLSVGEDVDEADVYTLSLYPSKLMQ